MTPIQLVLTTFLTAFVIVGLGRVRSRLLYRVVLLACALAGWILILLPDISSEIAHGLGVGRGVDLVLYCGVATLGMVCLLLYIRCRTLESRYTELVRAIAILHAEQVAEEASAGETIVRRVSRDETPIRRAA